MYRWKIQMTRVTEMNQKNQTSSIKLLFVLCNSRLRSHARAEGMHWSTSCNLAGRKQRLLFDCVTAATLEMHCRIMWILEMLQNKQIILDHVKFGKFT